jgi:hypothetical protein
MYKLGALTVEQVERVTANAPPDRRAVEQLIELGFLSRERVFELMRKRCEEIVYASLLVSDGTFFFLDGFDDGRLTVRLHLQAAGLLMEGVRRMDEVKYFRQRIPSDEHVPMRIAGREGPPEKLAPVHAACDGKRSIGDIGRACGLSEFEATHAVFQLMQSGFLQIRPPLATSAEGSVALFNEAMRAIFETLERAAPGKANGVRSQLSMYASTAGVYDVLFMGAGPEPDGAVTEARVAKNLAVFGGEDAVEQLGEWLYDYAAYALFSAVAELPKEEEEALSKRVHARLSLLAPRSVRGS